MQLHKALLCCVPKHPLQVQGVFEVLKGPPADTKASISNALCSKTKADGAAAIVIGSSSRGGLKEALLGSIAANLAHNCDVPVVVLHKPRAEEAAGKKAGNGQQGAADVTWLLRASTQEILGEAAMEQLSPRQDAAEVRMLLQYHTAHGPIHRTQHCLLYSFSGSTHNVLGEAAVEQLSPAQDAAGMAQVRVICCTLQCTLLCIAVKYPLLHHCVAHVTGCCTVYSTAQCMGTQGIASSSLGVRFRCKARRCWQLCRVYCCWRQPFAHQQPPLMFPTHPSLHRLSSSATLWWL
jgi:hypothetical protein